MITRTWRVPLRSLACLSLFLRMACSLFFGFWRKKNSSNITEFILGRSEIQDGGRSVLAAILDFNPPNKTELVCFVEKADTNKIFHNDSKKQDVHIPTLVRFVLPEVRRQINDNHNLA